MPWGAASWSFIRTELYPVPYRTLYAFLPTMPSGNHNSSFPLSNIFLPEWSLCLLALMETWFLPEDTDPSRTLSCGNTFLLSGLVPRSLEEMQSSFLYIDTYSPPNLQLLVLFKQRLYEVSLESFRDPLGLSLSFLAVSAPGLLSISTLTDHLRILLTF